MDLIDQLNQLRSKFANRANEVLSEWDYTFGGACDMIADELANVVVSHIDNVTLLPGGQDGDDHAWVIVVGQDAIAELDIPYYLYEFGGGYSWQGIPDAHIEPADVWIGQIDDAHVIETLREYVSVECKRQ